jgi:hypothetical protein
MFGLSTVHQGRTKEVKDARPKSIFLLTREREKKNNKFQHLLYTYIYPPLSLSLSFSLYTTKKSVSKTWRRVTWILSFEIRWAGNPFLTFVSCPILFLCISRKKGIAIRSWKVLLKRRRRVGQRWIEGIYSERKNRQRSPPSINTVIITHTHTHTHSLWVDRTHLVCCCVEEKIKVSLSVRSPLPLVYSYPFFFLLGNYSRGEGER